MKLRKKQNLHNQALCFTMHITTEMQEQKRDNKI